MTPTLKATLVTLSFAAAGALSWYFAPGANPTPSLLLFYTVLTVNTYFSVRLFASITPRRLEQQAIDGLLVLWYLLLALNLAYPQWFTLYSLGLFATATLKYVLLIGVIPHPALLRRKIIIDSLGMLLCAAAALGVWLGYTEAAASAYAFIFAAANIYLLAIKPMYRL